MRWSPAVLKKFWKYFTSKEGTDSESFIQYLNISRGASNHIRYNFRNKGHEDIKKVFEVTEEQEAEMKAYFWKIFQHYLDETLESYDVLALRVAEWVNRKTIYTTDKTKRNIEEYWASPYELYREIKDYGTMKDDCDAYAVLIVYIWGLMGIPAERRFVRAGDVNTKTGKYNGGHATAIYLPYQNPINFYPLEGSYYAKETNKKFLTLPLLDNKLYGNTWFVVNEDRSYRGDV